MNPPPRTIVHDIRGQICPSCLLFALQQVNEKQEGLRDGSIRIVIRTDNRDATGTIPEAVVNMGYGVAVEAKDGYYEIAIQRPGAEDFRS
ncbi:MAG: sulfurtransferase TusA family protein [Desulfobulbaceae bacterium]